MSAVTETAGYPVHAVAKFHEWTNPHRARFTDWQAACGATGFVSGTRDAFSRAGSARWRELCPRCSPARHGTYHPNPVAVFERLCQPATLPSTERNLP